MLSYISKVFWRQASAYSSYVLNKMKAVWVQFMVKLDSLLAWATQLLLDSWHEQSKGTAA